MNPEIEKDSLVAFGWLLTWCEKAGVNPLEFREMWVRSFADTAERLALSRQETERAVGECYEAVSERFKMIPDDIAPLSRDKGTKTLREGFNVGKKVMRDHALSALAKVADKYGIKI